MFDCAWVREGRHCSWSEPSTHVSNSEIEQNFRNQILKYIVRCYQPERLTPFSLVEKRWLVLLLHTYVALSANRIVNSFLHLEKVNLIVKKAFYVVNVI